MTAWNGSRPSTNCIGRASPRENTRDLRQSLSPKAPDEILARVRWVPVLRHAAPIWNGGEPFQGASTIRTRGAQYAASDYVEALKQAELRPSMPRKGNPYDNARVESFMKTLKVEEVYLRQYRTYQDVLASVPRFIEAVYNAKRLHSSLGYQSPDEFEAQQQRKLEKAMTVSPNCPA